MAPQVNSYVTEVKIEESNGKQIATISIKLEGFEEDEHVQLSGYAAQKNGGFVAISEDHRIDGVDSTGVSKFDVVATPSAPFKPGAEVVSGLWAAKVWMTVLKAKPDGPMDWVPDYWMPQ